MLFEAGLQDVGDAELKFPWETGVRGQFLVMMRLHSLQLDFSPFIILALRCAKLQMLSVPQRRCKELS